MAGLIKVTFLGDILCERPQIAAVDRVRCGYGVVFEQVKHLWADSDYVVANLETPLAGHEFKLAYEKMRFNAPVEFGVAIRDSGIGHVSIANNHALDRSEDGLLATMHNLDKIGLDYSGAYIDKESSVNFFVKEVGGLRLAFISCTYDFNKSQFNVGLPEDRLWRLDLLKHPAAQIDTMSYRIKSFLSGLIPTRIRGTITSALRHEKLSVVPDSVRAEEFGRPEHRLFFNHIIEKIKRAKKTADVVVVLPHIGGQYAESPGVWQSKTVDALVEAGANIVVCNHVHVPQPVERRGDALVAHCLGNFCFTPTIATTAHGYADYSVLLNCWVDKDSRKIAKQNYVLLKTEKRLDGVSVVVPTKEKWQGWRC